MTVGAGMLGGRSGGVGGLHHAVREAPIEGPHSTRVEVLLEHRIAVPVHQPPSFVPVEVGGEVVHDPRAPLLDHLHLDAGAVAAMTGQLEPLVLHELEHVACFDLENHLIIAGH